MLRLSEVFVTEKQRVVFATSFESLFSPRVRERLTPAMVALLKELGVDVNKPFQAGYPAEIFAAAVFYVCDALYPGKPRAEALFALGAEFIEGFAATLMGKAAFGVMRLIGPARSLERVARTYATASDYSVVKVTRTGPTSYEFSLNEKHTPPQYEMGILSAGLKQLGTKSPRVTLKSADAEGFVLDISWEP